jgi:8-amino-7-oxononanoate synthase
VASRLSEERGFERARPSTFYSMLFSSVTNDLARLKQEGLVRHRRVLESPQGVRVKIGGREYLAFCSNDYLGLASHPALVAAVREGAELWGVGAGASHLVSGHAYPHERLERALAEFVGLPAALLFSTGYMANFGVVMTLVSRQDAIFADRLNHASLNDAALLSRAKFQRYPHLDLNALDRLLAASQARTKLVISDVVFSMDGDIAPLPELLELCDRHDAWLLIDDAHGFGVLGNQGKGTLSHFRISSPRIIYMATLGKAAGVFGAFVAAEHCVIEALIQHARTYIYTTAPPPLLAHALATSLDLIRADEWRRRLLQELIAALRKDLKLSRWRLGASETAIQPLIIGDHVEAVQVSEMLAQNGIWVPAIRPPTVLRGTARLRISLSAQHRIEDVEHLIDALHDAERTLAR